MGIKAIQVKQLNLKPILKWAGGKTQLLTELMERFPGNYNKYIEPFFGGGALYFHHLPSQAVIGDSNNELINLYKTVAEEPSRIISILRQYPNTETFFYEMRAHQPESLNRFEAAARTIYLNRTCFNGLYRVNRNGQFNVPFGRYANPRIVDPEGLNAAANALQDAIIVHGDYKNILRQYAAKGDLVFLDPPYLPISKYADFKRYTKEQFYEEDHRELAEEVIRLHELGCYVLLTNSNHPLVHDLYGRFKIEVVKTKRNINSDAGKRLGEDVIVTIPPKKSINLHVVPAPLSEQTLKYPSTRWMGSKSKILPHLRDIAQQFEFNTVLDLFSGSGIVSYMFKTMGKRVISNDYMALSATYTKAMVENNHVKLSLINAQELMIKPKGKFNDFVQKTFDGLYFNSEDNLLIDILLHNIGKMHNSYEKAIAKAALVRACTKKRPRGIFTYVGYRYDDGRKDLKLTLAEHFLTAVAEINNAVFDNERRNLAYQSDAMNLRRRADLVYIDPPYFSPLSDNEYVRRYHFVEGIACNWKGLEIQEHTKTKKFKSYPTPFSSQKGAHDAFDKLFRKYRNSILLVSYSSNSLPSLDEMVALMSKYKMHVEVKNIDYKYSFGTQTEGIQNNEVKEYIFVGY